MPPGSTGNFAAPPCIVQVVPTCLQEASDLEGASPSAAAHRVEPASMSYTTALAQWAGSQVSVHLPSQANAARRCLLSFPDVIPAVLSHYQTIEQGEFADCCQKSFGTSSSQRLQEGTA